MASRAWERSSLVVLLAHVGFACSSSHRSEPVDAARDPARLDAELRADTRPVLHWDAGPAQDAGARDTCAPVSELCNDHDDDCDGWVDEDVAVGGPCSAGEGGCRSEGHLRCEEGRYERCSAMPTEPGEETCDASDDDCDGRVDEGTTVPCQAGIGACLREGTQVCIDGGLAICSASPGEPRVETCDGIDEDCDGVVDGGAPDCGVVALALGAYHSCALRRGGSVLCWGENWRGQLYPFTRGTALDLVMTDTPGGSTFRSERDRLHA